MSRTACPAPGIYRGVPAREYHAWDGASNSRLSAMHGRSPAHLRHEMDNPRESTEAMILGDAIHLAILQPELWPGIYTVGGQCAATTKSTGHRCRNAGVVRRGDEWFCGVKGHDPRPGEADPAGFTILSDEHWRTCLRLRDAVQAHADVAALLHRATDREVSIVWDDPETGVRCKARLDAVAWDVGMVGDLKSTTDASPAAFSRSVWNFGYHRQAAHYLNGCAVLAGMGLIERAPDSWVFLPAEKSEPFPVAFYPLEDDAIEAGRHQLRRLLARYAECLSSDCWEGYPTRSISLPAFAWGQLDD